ncbi:hypothetical protein V6N13_008037 [Hibiscus sabdariffa]
MWAQRINRQPLREPVTPGKTVATGYMQWFYENGKPFIMTTKVRARVLRRPRPEQARPQRVPRSTCASTRAPSTSVGRGSAPEGPSTESYTSMPSVFSHASSSQFQYTMAPLTEGFFARAFQPYSSMMTAPLHSPLAVYPPQDTDADFIYGMVQHTPPGSLFASGPSGSGHQEQDENEADTDEDDDDDDDDDAPVRRNPRRNRRPPPCGTGGHRRH